MRWLLQFKSPEGQLARWIEWLQTYDINIEHRRGIKHGNADALSRRPCNLECKHCMKAKKESIVVIWLIRIEANANWCEAQRSDPILTKIIAAKGKDKRPTRNEIRRRSSYKSILGTMGQSEAHKRVLMSTFSGKALMASR